MARIESASARARPSAESALWRATRLDASDAASVSVSGRGARGTCVSTRSVFGATTIDTSAVTNVPIAIAPMKAGRCIALRARFLSQAGLVIAFLRSETPGERASGRVGAGTLARNAKGGRVLRARLLPLYSIGSY